MDSMSSYDKHMESVRRQAIELKRPLEICQSTLWAKAIAVEAFAGKFDDIKCVGTGDTFGFSEKLVNQCMEFASRRAREGMSDAELHKKAYTQGYKAARREFAKATGLYTEDDLDGSC